MDGGRKEQYEVAAGRSLRPADRLKGRPSEVAPASYLPYIARDWGATIVENNLSPTRLTRTLTDHQHLPAPLKFFHLRFGRGAWGKGK